MKSIIFCLLLVSMVVMNNVGVEARKKFIGIGVLDPCSRPGGWHPGCPIHKGKATLPKPARPYTRGLLKNTSVSPWP